MEIKIEKTTNGATARSKPANQPGQGKAISKSQSWFRSIPSLVPRLHKIIIPRGQSVLGHVAQAKMWGFPPVRLGYVIEVNSSLRGRRSKGKGKGIRARDHAGGRREEGNPSLLPRAPLAFLSRQEPIMGSCSRLKLPFQSFLSLPFQTPATQAKWIALCTITENRFCHPRPPAWLKQPLQSKVLYEQPRWATCFSEMKRRPENCS